MNCICVYVDGGKGHYVPAITLKEEFEKMGHNVYLEEFFNLLDINWIGKINKLFWRTMLKNSKVENSVSRHNDNSNGMEVAVNAAKKLCMKRLLSYIEKTDPDFIFTTHPYAGTIISEMLKAKGIDIPVYYYATDVFSAPVATITNALRRFYIPTEEGRECVIKMGMEEDKVVICPFPLMQNIANAPKLTKEEAREKLGLDENLFTMQFNLGGEGLGALDILYRLKDADRAMQIVVIGGLDDTMRHKLEEIEKNLSKNIKLKIIGFVKNVNEYLIASDIVVGRAGINTLVEAFYAHRPFLITELVYTVMSSADYVEKYHVGWNCNRDPEKQASIIIDLIDNPEKLEEMDKNFNNIPIEYNASKFAKMVIEDVNDYKSESSLTQKAIEEI